jgi:tetratricopeptide (TPR) repeat protein
VVTPGPILPAREILADILLKQGRPEEALAEYGAVLLKEPNRYRALAGAAQAAQEAGNMKKALVHTEHLIAQVGAAGSEHASLELARDIAGASQN